jgi:hypothetical protein
MLPKASRRASRGSCALGLSLCCCCCPGSSSWMAIRMPTGSSFSAAFIRWPCIFPSACWYLFRCLNRRRGLRPALREAAGFVLGLLRSLVAWRSRWAFCSPTAAEMLWRASRAICGAASRSPLLCSVCCWPAVSGRRMLRDMCIPQCLRACACWFGGRGPGRLAHAWQQLPDAIHAGGLKRCLGSRHRAPRLGHFTPGISTPFSMPIAWLSWRGQSKGGLRMDSYEC